MNNSNTKICKIEGCSKQGQMRKLMCDTHYRQILRGSKVKVGSTIYTHRPAIINGDIAKIPLGIDAKNGYAFVDASFSWIDRYKWTIDKNGYAVSSRNGTTVRMHHIILGKPSGGLVTDHINRIRTDNRKVNLRFITQRENCLNTVRHENIYAGVSKHRKRWVARIRVGGEKIGLGTYDTPDEAAAAYRRVYNSVAPK